MTLSPDFNHKKPVRIHVDTETQDSYERDIKIRQALAKRSMLKSSSAGFSL